MSTGFEREASPKSWEEEVGSLGEPFLGGSFDELGIFFGVNFWALDFFGGEKIGDPFRKKGL